jgi:hypothetical protein
MVERQFRKHESGLKLLREILFELPCTQDLNYYKQVL